VSGTSGHTCLLVDHDFTEYSAEESSESVSDARRLDVDVSASERLATLDVNPRFKQRVVEATDEATHRRLVETLLASRVVGVDGQTVEVVHVVAVVDVLVCHHHINYFRAMSYQLQLLISYSVSKLLAKCGLHHEISPCRYSSRLIPGVTLVQCGNILRDNI